MKKFILLFLFTISATAQIKGVVRDSITKVPIAYVSILVENKEIGTTSALDGSFEINSKLETNDNLLFSIIGYGISKVKISDCSNVLLVSKSITIQEVIIKSIPIKKIEQLVGNAKKSNIYFSFPSYPIMISKKFEYKSDYEKTPFLKKISVITATNIEDATFKLRLFKIDSLTQLPNESLLNEEIIVKVKRKGKYINEIDLSNYNLEFPKEGLVVGIENVLIIDNLNTIRYKNSENEIKYKDYYEPTILLNNTNENSYIYDNFRWKKIVDILKINTSITKSQKTVEPAINITLSN
jgi:hypothetical protein